MLLKIIFIVVYVQRDAEATLPSEYKEIIYFFCLGYTLHFKSELLLTLLCVHLMSPDVFVTSLLQLSLTHYQIT